MNAVSTKTRADMDDGNPDNRSCRDENAVIGRVIQFEEQTTSLQQGRRSAQRQRRRQRQSGIGLLMPKESQKQLRRWVRLLLLLSLCITVLWVQSVWKPRLRIDDHSDGTTKAITKAATPMSTNYGIESEDEMERGDTVSRISHQSREMKEAMWRACSSGKIVGDDGQDDAWIRLTRPDMVLDEFIDMVVTKLYRYARRDMDPLVYVASNYYTELVQHRGAFPSGIWTEFGVFRGGSLLRSYKALHNQTLPANAAGRGPLRMVGFDSFQGLPVSWRDGFNATSFASPYEKARKRLPKDVTLYRGWFQDSIGQFLLDLKDEEDEPLAVLNHDGDLFVSTAITFSLLNERISPGMILCFDELFGYPEFRQHEMLALFVWMKSSATSFSSENKGAGDGGTVLCPLSVLDSFDPINATNGSEQPEELQGCCFQVLQV